MSVEFGFVVGVNDMVINDKISSMKMLDKLIVLVGNVHIHSSDVPMRDGVPNRSVNRRFAALKAPDAYLRDGS